MIEIDQARGLLARAVLTQGPDFIYNPGGAYTCTYQPQLDLEANNPRRITGCLIGVALDMAGETRHHRAGGNVDTLSKAYPELMSAEVKDYFWTAQIAQDRGQSWGAAFRAAEESLDS